MSDIDTETRRQLEINFAKSIDKIIDQLLYSNFSENDIVIFTNTVNTFLKFEDLKTYILDAIHDKIMEASKIIKPNDQIRFASFRKLIGIVLDINNQDLIDSLETFLSRKQPPDHFFVFVEEKIKRGINIETATNSFVELVRVHHHPLKIIDRFLEIIGEGRSYIIEKLLQLKLPSFRSSLQSYISDIIVNEPDKIGVDVVPTIIKSYIGDSDQYFYLIQEILAHTTDFHHTLLNDSVLGDCVFQFWAHIIKHQGSYLAIVKNFYFYLEKYNPEFVDQFETEFLQATDPVSMVRFSTEVPSSKKRKILRRLVETKSEAQLVAFIKKFPEYDSLLPML